MSWLSTVYREEWIGDFLVVEYTPVELERPSYAIVSLPDTGLVGVITAQHVIKSLNLREATGIDSYAHLPQLLVFSEKKIRAPVRVFAGENLVVVY